jgi:hypothetical protein
MHIHAGYMNTQMMALSASQGTQQAAEARKAAAEVRRKLGHFAATADNEGVHEVEAYSPSDSREEAQPDADSFKHFFSITA